ncbi:hypothetical protein BU23DRAFT_277337 [Bimuria novae-zelandiae CBS 107.79]|uniref:Uncharacterized protein n=1 Tax=Bimuria novae-zelandiae CBS 107.79 TaxID=1447943 RepID=A0A6A5VMP6_9PLEO|nr:hypothetical protein BU23DRAFT_277337 [Bimuria novae-zelandiae CBS 107.79]
MVWGGSIRRISGLRFSNLFSSDAKTQAREARSNRKSLTGLDIQRPYGYASERAATLNGKIFCPLRVSTEAKQRKLRKTRP